MGAFELHHQATGRPADSRLQVADGSSQVESRAPDSPARMSPPLSSSPFANLNFNFNSNSNQLASHQTRDAQTQVATARLQHCSMESISNFLSANMIELALVCVIIIYLVYYFSQISRRPKLIGNKQSKFVTFVSSTLADTLKRRFSPLIYFWGTNPQTALFGYLQGQTSEKEFGRDKFARQLIYVSDAQYLASNVDLKHHYAGRLCAGPSQAIASHKMAPLELCVQLRQLDCDRPSEQINRTPPAASQIDQNIRLALANMLKQTSSPDQHEHEQQQQQQRQRPQHLVQENNNSTASSHFQAHHLVESNTTPPPTKIGAGSSSSSSSSSSSCDSGVFASSSSNQTPALSSSGSSLTIDMTLEQQPCRCATKPIHEFEFSGFGGTAGGSPEPTSVAPPGGGQSNQQARELADYGQCALDWYRDSHQHYHTNKLVALISAGMTTGSDKKYVTDTVRTLASLGYEVCVFIRRGVGGLKLTSAKFFSPSKWRDFEAAIQSVRKQRPGARLVAVGFSFGSIELCRYLAMTGAASLVDAALLVSCPFDPEKGGKNMRKQALNRKIDAYLAKNLGKQLHHALDASALANATPPPQPQQQQQRRQSGATHDTCDNPQQQQQLKPVQSSISMIYQNSIGSQVDLANLPRVKSLVEFETNFNRVIQSYPSSEAYAADSRLHEQLARIEVPTLCISSEDDFMAPKELLPLNQIEANGNLCMVLTKRGGHMAFIDGLLWPRKPYFAQRIITNYMTAIKNVDFLQQNKTSERQCTECSKLSTTMINIANKLANGAAGARGYARPPAANTVEYPPRAAAPPPMCRHAAAKVQQRAGSPQLTSPPPPPSAKPTTTLANDSQPFAHVFAARTL